MNRTVFLLFFFFVLAWMTRAQKRDVYVYGVAFYNLENLFDTLNTNGTYDQEFSPDGARQWTGEKYWSKQRNMAIVFKGMASKIIPDGPAVAGVVELENRSVLEDLVRQKPIRAWNWQIVHYDSPDRRGVDVALLYNPRFFKVLHSASHRLMIASKPDFLTRDQLVVTGLLGGIKISFIVNHWPSRLGGETKSSPLRDAAASLTLSIADSLMRDDPKTGIVIMGDLNDDPTSKSVRTVLNAKKKMEEVPDGGFYNATWPLFEKGIGTLGYRGSWNLFDQFIISKNLLGKPQADELKFWSAQVFNKPFLTNDAGQYKGYPKRTFAGGVFLNGYSDHFPTLIYLIRPDNHKDEVLE